MKIACLLWLAILGSHLAEAHNVPDLVALGIKGDGLTMNTAALQSAIDSASRNGGGVVALPRGTYLTGTLWLKSHVEFRLDSGAVLLGSASRADYQRNNWYALLVAENQEDIKVTGGGTIDGQGLLLARDAMRRAVAGEFGPEPTEVKYQQQQSLRLSDAEFGEQTCTDRVRENQRPLLIEFSHCRGVTVAGVTLKNASCWVQNYIRCEGLMIDGVKVESTAYWNNDGMDITDCRHVTIKHCNINSADDGICLKSGAGGVSGWGEGNSVKDTSGCDQVVISDCRIRSSANAVKFGTASYGGFRRIRVSNLTVYDTFRCAIALETVDGGTVNDVLIEGVTATNTGGAIFMRLGRRNLNEPPGKMQHVTIRNFKIHLAAGKPDSGYPITVPFDNEGSHQPHPSSITGLPGSPVRDVRLENIEIVARGDGRAKIAPISTAELDAVPEMEDKYPEYSMFGRLPAWGFYVRHADGIQFVNVHLSRELPDDRPACVFDDVRRLKTSELSFDPTADRPHLVMRDVCSARIQFKEAVVEKDSLLILNAGQGAERLR